MGMKWNPVFVASRTPDGLPARLREVRRSRIAYYRYGGGYRRMRRLGIAVLAVGGLLAIANQRTKGTEMQTTQNVALQERTEAIHARLVTQWEAWKNKDAASNDAVIADDFSSISADGLRRAGKPTLQQMAEQPISGYKLSEFRVLPVRADAALITYFADIKTPDNLEHHMAVGEYWEKHNGQWFIHGFSGTLMK